MSIWLKFKFTIIQTLIRSYKGIRHVSKNDGKLSPFFKNKLFTLSIPSLLVFLVSCGIRDLILLRNHIPRSEEVGKGDLRIKVSSETMNHRIIDLGRFLP